MPEESYFCVISTSPDGIGVESLSKEILERRLNEDYYGDPIFLSSFPEESHPDYWATNVGAHSSKTVLLIIKGRVITPLKTHWKLP